MLTFSSVQSLSRVWLFATPWTAACQASLSSPTPGACLNSCLLSWWYHPTISSSVIPFSSRLQSFPASDIRTLENLSFCSKSLSKYYFRTTFLSFKKLFQAIWYFKIKMNHMKINYKLKNRNFLLALSVSLYSDIVQVLKNPPANAGNIKDVGAIPGSERWRRRKWQSTPVFLPGESHVVWWATVHRVAQSQTRLKRVNMLACIYLSISTCYCCLATKTCPALLWPHGL